MSKLRDNATRGPTVGSIAEALLEGPEGFDQYWKEEHKGALNPDEAADLVAALKNALWFAEGLVTAHEHARGAQSDKRHGMVRDAHDSLCCAMFDLKDEWG